MFRAAKAARAAQPPQQQRPAPGQQRQRGVAFGTGVGDEDDTYGMVRTATVGFMVQRRSCSACRSAPVGLEHASAGSGASKRPQLIPATALTTLCNGTGASATV